uniref:Uncharacterized protein n=1 Tax=Brassica oleracea TaxID=3712 RepID=A0A3P6DM75_BRAOL|nr:unnamed protein product [Brassica oleracea]
MIIYATEVQTINSFLRLESLKEVYGLIWIFVPIFSLVLGIITGVLVIVWLEREISAGYNNVLDLNIRPPGILQALARRTKLLFKEDLHPSRGNTPLFSIGPSIAAYLYFTKLFSNSC